MFTDQYFDKKKYSESINKFNDFMSFCKIEKSSRKPFSEFQVSTITCVSTIADTVNTKRVCQFIDVNNNPDIQYIESDTILKGKKKNKKVKDAVMAAIEKLNRGLEPKKKRKNQLFSNQISIGFICPNKIHDHKNPISVKLFRNGRIQMTGCKNMEEIEVIYNKLYNILQNIPIHFVCPNGRTITLHVVQNIIPYRVQNMKTEMINGTFYTNVPLNVEKMNEVIQKKYTEKDLYIKSKRSPLNLSISSLGYFDKIKKVKKTPSVFVYSTGSINIIATRYEILQKTYNFIVDLLNENYDTFKEKNYIMNDEYISKNCPYKHYMNRF